MFEPLSPEAVRVLGVLVEKELSTPEYYPLTLNSLTNACNQKSNRDPVVAYHESEVRYAIEELEKRRLIGHVTGAGSRAEKFRHTLAESMGLSERERAALAVLLLRGPQTIGEVKGRTGRMAEFDSLDDAADVLRALRDREEPLLVQLPMQPGKKEARLLHLLGGEPDLEALEAEATAHPAGPTSSLTEELHDIKQRLADLEDAFERFKQQFE
ncbi:MAG: YceH family protein [Rhodothermales bacterium]